MVVLHYHAERSMNRRTADNMNVDIHARARVLTHYKGTDSLRSEINEVIVCISITV